MLLHMLSSSTLVLDSRDRQGQVWLPYNLAALAAFTILFAAELVNWSDMLSQLKIYSKSVYTH